MSVKHGKIQRKVGENGNLEKLAKFLRRGKVFLGQCYVRWSLTVGFLWMLSTPFIVTIFQRFLGNFIEIFTWIFQAVYFPITISSMIFAGMSVPGVWMIVYGFSFVISMCFCLATAHIIHRYRTKICKTDS